MNHDASISVVDSSSLEILFAGHAERYSRIKNDQDLNEGLIADAMSYGKPDLVVWFENPWGRKLRYLMSGQHDLMLSEQFPKSYLKRWGITAPIKYSSHHASHAAGGFYTSGFEHAAVLVVDAIGEITTASIWEAKGSKLKKKWTLKYPHSVGLFYSAVTDLVGLKPNEEEYILMGMAAYGTVNEDLREYLLTAYFKSDSLLKQQFNFHRGIRSDLILQDFIKSEQGKFDLAATAQEIVEDALEDLFELTADLVDSGNLVYSGGVALNCVANTKLTRHFDKMWIMPNPGDAGNSLGAVANYLRHPLKWRGPFLGHDIKKDLDVNAIVDELLMTGICGVACGRAEFGPRALGNRSLLADPRRKDMKDRVNEIKRRQKFRPFAPAILTDRANDYFELPENITDANYMQYVVGVRVDHLPAITHFDWTARVQTVDDESPNLKRILEAWYVKTGCPVLLNTSLNIKGEPLVNTIEDGQRFAQKYGVKVL